MRKILGTLALLAIVLGGIGMSRGWFTVTRDHNGSETDVHVQIHREKIRSDTHGAAGVAKELGENIEKRFADGTSGNGEIAEKARSFLQRDGS